MGFERIVPMHIEGTTLFGIDLSCLHSDDINRQGLKDWVDAFSHLITDNIGQTSFGEDTPFYDVFKLNLGFFCIYVANSDGSVSDEEIEAINWLIDYRETITRSAADSMIDVTNKSTWRNHYSISFLLIVAELGKSKDIMTVAQAAYFYKQVARYVYSIDNRGDFTKDSPAAGYVDALFKYVERTSACGFSPAKDEFTMEEVCEAWDDLVQAEDNHLRNAVCGTWKGVSGNALFSGGLSDLVLTDDGRGYMLRKKLFGQKRVDVTWEVSELPGMNSQAPVVYIPDMRVSVVMVMLDAGRMAATVYSNDSSLNLRMAVYQRA